MQNRVVFYARSGSDVDDKRRCHTTPPTRDFPGYKHSNGDTIRPMLGKLLCTRICPHRHIYTSCPVTHLEVDTREKMQEEAW